MAKKLSILVFFSFFILSWGQNLETVQIVKIFSQSQPFKWEMPVPNAPHIPIEWRERKTSFSSEGIRSFAGYYQGDFVASLSINKNAVSGNYTYHGDSFDITSQNGKLVFKKIEDLQCRIESDTHKNTHQQELIKVLEESSNAPKIKNTNVLRIYRLAIPIAYNYYKEDWAFGSIEKVKTFWADTEVFLNEVYVRDLGIRFELVNDERLILTTPAQERFDENQRASTIINFSTQIINDLIGNENYDLGLCISKFSSKGISGLAYVRNAYSEDKAAAIARPTKQTISHEIGHLFGGLHTFSGDYVDTGSEKTEYGRGQSVMSYGNPRDFFSLSSIERIRQFLVNTPYYADKARTQVVGDASFPNIPYGIRINNQAPHIDNTKIKANYTIPQNTYFQFYISASDLDNTKLLYTVNQHDVRFGQEQSASQYIIYKPSSENPVYFKKEYSERTGNEMANSWLSSQKTGTFTFWLGVSDAQPHLSSDYITQYDIAETKVTVKDGLPFILTNTMKKEYKGGEKLTLTWQVDNGIFKDTKVRILLSDDFGKTFKYILAESIDNNGNYEITLPNVKIENKNFGSSGISVPAGVIKIEVIDGLAFALTNYNPKNGGGFMIKTDDKLPSPLAFTSIPNDISLSCENTIPPVVMPTVSGGCSPKISYKEEKINGNCSNRYTIKRIFTATDSCNQSISHTQLIEVEDTTAPVFVQPLPQNLTIQEGDSIPVQAVLTATDNCGTATVTSSKKEEKTNGKISKIIYTWTAKDSCGNESFHTQIITIKPKESSKNEVEIKPELLYPNPVDNIFYLQGLHNIQEIKIFDTSGRLIKTFTEQKEYNTSGMAAGVYVVFIKGENYTRKFKIIKR